MTAVGCTGMIIQVVQSLIRYDSVQYIHTVHLYIVIC